MSPIKILVLGLFSRSLCVLAQEEPYVDPKNDLQNRSICYAIGLFLRLPFAADTHNLGMFICMNTIIVLSPCAFIATVYMLLGRLALHLDADEYLLVKAKIITKLFLTSDIVTLLIQAAGGSMVTNRDLSEVGNKIRSVFRTVEHSQGFNGHLATTESYFYALDALPLFVSILDLATSIYWGTYVGQSATPFQFKFRSAL
ncbi:RTA1-like protein [Rhizoctonia solani]|uniref:RTA1-like protein n=1 Tax=Rhizoctonia solani TaxID=456999 RepID=A0A8H8NZ61_9AGAM|nr:RTA1-like protein [Rhizoctonia solani]QRW20978.1 RTA1-like protein [Rhizoctonia solani]